MLCPSSVRASRGTPSFLGFLTLYVHRLGSGSLFQIGSWVVLGTSAVLPPPAGVGATVELASVVQL